MNKDKILALLTESINEIKTALSAPVLDGTPYLVTNIVVRPDGEVTTLVYGHWPMSDGTIKGFKHAEAVPTHLCGTVTFGKSEAQKNAALFSATEGGQYGILHTRDFLTARLASLEQTIAALQAV